MSIAARRLQRSATDQDTVTYYRYGFEAGTNGSTVSTSVTAVGDTAWSAIGIGSGASLVYDTTHAMSGSLSARLDPGSSVQTAMRWIAPSNLSGALRYYVWWDANPTTDITIAWLGSTSSAKTASIVIGTTGNVRVYGTQAASAYATASGALPLGAWARVELAYQINSGASANGKIRLGVYLGDSATPIADSGWITTDLGTAGVTYARIGKYDTSANTTSHWIDAITLAAGATSLLGPAGTPTNQSPMANAGSDQTVLTSSVVTLDGSGSSDSDGTIASYAWAQTSGTSVTLSSTSAQHPTFTAPGTTDTLVFSLTVTDNNGATSAADTVTVTVSDGTPIDDAGSLAVGSASYSVPGGAIFMATNGVDTNSGTISSPVASLTKAISLVSAGGTIVIRGGSYNDGDDTQSQTYVYGVWLTKNATIQNYPGEAVWFDGSVAVTGSWTANGSTWSTPYDRLFNRSPTTVDGADDGWGASTGAGGWWTTEDDAQACWPDMVFLDGTQLTQVKTLAEVTSGTFFVDGATTTGKWFQGTTLYIGDNPAGHEIRYANKCKLMTLGGTSNASTIRGIGIRRYASYIVGFAAIYNQHNLTLENVWVEDMRASFMHCDSSNSLNVTKFTARRIGFDCLGGNQASNIVIDRADMRGCNYARFNLYGPSVATIKFNKMQYCTVKNSIFKDSYSTGFWCDSTGNTPIIVNCLFQNLSNRAIDFETASDSIAANCKFIGNGGLTILLNDSDTTRIYNCTFAENNWGYANISNSTALAPIWTGQSSRCYNNSAFSFNYDSRLGASYYTDYPQHQWTMNYITVCNNVFARPGVHTYSMFYNSNNGDSFRDPNRTFLANMHPTMDGNVYQWTTRPQYPWVAAAGYQVNPTVKFSLSDWQSFTSLETNSSFTTTDPLNSNYEVTNQTYHNNAVTIPTDIAALIGQSTSAKRAGAFW